MKNSVFVDLFCYDEMADRNVISLYNALHEESISQDVYIRKIRVDNVLYMTFCNDVSFGIEDKTMVFAEHQSTINKNMPLRSLLYARRAYEKIVPDNSKYRKKQVTIPRPEFYTFYNGCSKWEKETILRLSDAYACDSEENMLELTVHVINMLFGDYNYDDDIRVQREEEREDVLDVCAKLLVNGRQDEIMRAASDKVYRQKLFKEFQV